MYLNKKSSSIKQNIFCLFVLFVIIPKSFSQNDCTDAIIVCGNNDYSNLAATGAGIQELSGNNSCSMEENNSLWLKVNISAGGTLGFTIIPDSSSLVIDYDFSIFGPATDCSDLGFAIRCSTTNPQNAGLTTNYTGMDENETDESEGPGADGNSFVKWIDVLDNETYYIVIDRPEGNSNFSIEWSGTATFNQPPVFDNVTAGTLLDLEKCDADAVQDGSTNFDLTINSAIAIGTQSNIDATYYETLSDAVTQSNVISNPTTFVNTTNPQTIYVRLTNSITGCFETSEFELTVTPFQSSVPKDLIECDQDNDGFVTFQLDSNTAALINNNSDIAVAYFATNDNSMPLPNNYTNQTAFTNEIVWAKVYNTITGCFVFVAFNLIVNSPPILIPTQLTQCDIELNPDGLTTFNLNEATAVLTSNNPNLSTHFYLNLTDITELNLTFNNTSNPQIIYVKVINDLTGCFAQTTLTLNVSVNPTTQVTLTNCDLDGTEDGYTSFDLEDANFQTSTNTVTYFTNSTDALLELNPINSIFTNTIANEQIVYARIEDVNNCIGINTIKLKIIELPKFDLITLNTLCANNPTTPATIIANSSTPNNYQYLWQPSGETTAEITTFIPGTYTVKVTDGNNCTKTKSITIEASDVALIKAINISDLTENNTVEIMVTGNGEYVYSLDTNYNYQDTAFFENVPMGIHTVYIKDLNGCGIVEKEISVLGAPKFFTPNGDGYNDFWNIKGAINSKAIITIYNRFGKLIYQFSSTAKGWDGNFAGQLVPADDYWYTINFENGRSAKGHFSLKR